MKCPFCNSADSRVIDTRDVEDGIRRRRECQDCHQRFTTYERIAKINLMVVKRDGRREPFDRQKLFEGIRVACAKRPISVDQIDDIVARTETSLYGMAKSEVPSRAIGEFVMAELREIDGVAFVRFASVYRSFADLEDMQRQVEAIMQEGE